MTESRTDAPTARPTVLHGVALELQPRELRRSMRPAAVALQPLPMATDQDAEASRQATAASAAAHTESLKQAREQGHQEGYQDALRERRQEGYQAGFEQGSQEGMREGRALGEQEALRQARAGQLDMETRIERLDQWLNALQAQSRVHLAQRLNAAEDELIAIVHEVICRILGVAALEPASVGTMVRQAIEQCCGSDAAGTEADVTAIHVHPRDLEALQADPAMANWLLQKGASGVRWLPEPRLELGGCIVQGAQGDLDARLETQMAALRNLLIGARRSTADVADTGARP